MTDTDNHTPTVLKIINLYTVGEADHALALAELDELVGRLDQAERDKAALRDALAVAADLLAGEGYDRHPDYVQEWRTITHALASSGPAPEGTIRRRPCSSHCWQEGECDGSCGRNPKEAG